LTYQDFGETWDESGVYTRGIAFFHYLSGDARAAGFFLHRAAADDGIVLYNHLYSLILYLLNPAGDIDVYHWLNMAFAGFLFIAAYEVLLAVYQSSLSALLGPIFIFLIPRFTGDIPANPKDMPFAVLYFASLSAVFFLNRRPQIPFFVKGLILGCFFGLTQCVRTLGLTLFLLYFLFELKSYLLAPDGTVRKTAADFLKKTLPVLFVALLTAFSLLALSWPYLRSDFPLHLSEILSASKNFAWKNNVLFMGREVPADSLPWTYLPVWFIVTTPLFILLFLGLIFLMRDKLKNRLFVLFSAALALNFALVLGLKPVLYDGLRHFLFLLPVAAVLAAMSFIEFLKNTKSNLPRWGIVAAAGLNMAVVAGHMARLHPYEYVYFNEVTGGLRGSEGKFDNDYWGASYKEAVEWLKKNEAKDPKRILKVNGSGNAYQIAYYFAPNMRWSGFEDADYYLSCTRDEKHKRAEASKIIHVVEREGVPLNYVFKLR
jgi:hypothetical protein